jgi:chromosome segregation ATPase
MGLRSTLGGIFLAPALDRPIRKRVEEALEERLRTGEDDERLQHLETEVAALKKKLGMTMGTIQAATADLVALRKVADEAATSASQARQHATSALSTAESAADGVTALEDQVAALWKEVESSKPGASAKAAPPKRKKPAAKTKPPARKKPAASKKKGDSS